MRKALRDKFPLERGVERLDAFQRDEDSFFSRIPKDIIENVIEPYLIYTIEKAYGFSLVDAKKFAGEHGKFAEELQRVEDIMKFALENIGMDLKQFRELEFIPKEFSNEKVFSIVTLADIPHAIVYPNNCNWRINMYGYCDDICYYEDSLYLPPLISGNCILTSSDYLKKYQYCEFCNSTTHRSKFCYMLNDMIFYKCKKHKRRHFCVRGSVVHATSSRTLTKIAQMYEKDHKHHSCDLC